MIQITCKGNSASCTRTERITSGMVGLQCEFVFDEAWDGLAKTAVFMAKTAVFLAGNEQRDVLLTGDICTVPWEVLQNPGYQLVIGVYGSNADGTLTIPTCYAMCGSIGPGADPSGEESTDPTLPVWGQLQGMIGNLDNLETASKGNLVAAINEAAQSGGGSGGSGASIELDTTLTQSGTAADAKAVGDALAELEAQIPDAVLFTTQALTGEQKETARNNIDAKSKTPTLSAEMKTEIRNLISEYRNKNSLFRYHLIEGNQKQESKASTRNDYASASTVVSDNAAANGRYKIQCSLFAQLVWMGRSAEDFPSDTTLYTPDITKAFDWGYYFNFPLRKRVYGMHIGSGADTKYNGFVKPHEDDYKDSYSYTTAYTGAVDDPSGMGQTYTNFMGASEMARELYAMGCEIPFSELDDGDLVFFRTPSIADGKNDVSEWISFRHINHVAIVSRIDSNGNPVFAEAIEAFDSSPIMIESIESSANAWQAPRCSALMRWAVMCARHPAAFGKGGNVPNTIEVI